MKEQSAGKIKYHEEEIKVAGKTGTPQREVNRVRKSDGWYVFFAPTPNHKSFTVVCIRVELGELSSKAVGIANEIIGILKDKGYISSF
jgi:cell division protein FtsI/penicillin-binding protein 2